MYTVATTNPSHPNHPGENRQQCSTLDEAVAVRQAELDKTRASLDPRLHHFIEYDPAHPGVLTLGGWEHRIILPVE